MQPNRLSVVQTGENVNQAEVFRAHAVPQGLCGNLFNALKKLANQQEDGDGPIHSIVTNLCEESRKGLTDGLREFKKIDNHRALEVGHLKEGSGTWTFTIRRPKGQERCPEVAVKALWKVKAAKDAGEENHDPDRKDSILRRNKTRSALWEKHLKDPIVALDKALKCVEN